MKPTYTIALSHLSGAIFLSVSNGVRLLAKRRWFRRAMPVAIWTIATLVWLVD